MIDYDLTRIRAVVLDVDGVLSTSVVPMDSEGQPARTLNIKDGYILQQAAKHGLLLGIISGGRSEAVQRRYEGLGIRHIRMGAHTKRPHMEELCELWQISPAEVLYMGDDIPDIPVLQYVGCPCCPADASPDVKAVVRYVSHYRGGEGCVRDVLEQVMRAQGLWMDSPEAFGW